MSSFTSFSFKFLLGLMPGNAKEMKQKCILNHCFADAIIKILLFLIVF